MNQSAKSRLQTPILFSDHYVNDPIVVCVYSFCPDAYSLVIELTNIRSFVALFCALKYRSMSHTTGCRYIIVPHRFAVTLLNTYTRTQWYVVVLSPISHAFLRSVTLAYIHFILTIWTGCKLRSHSKKCMTDWIENYHRPLHRNVGNVLQSIVCCTRKLRCCCNDHVCAAICCIII